MSVYDSNRLSRMAVRSCGSNVEIEFGVNSFTRYSLREILAMCPTDLSSTIEILGGNHTYRVSYSHFIYRVLLVIGLRPSNNSKPKVRLELLRSLVNV